MAENGGVKSYDRALLNCLVMGRDLVAYLRQREMHKTEADGQKSDGESE